MLSYKFKDWEDIDGSSVGTDEVEASFDTVMQQAKTIEKEQTLMLMKKRSTRIRRAAVAAAVVVLAVVSPLAWHIVRSTQPETAFAEITVPDGEIQEVTLSDGSIVALNAGSTLTYPERFGKERAVTLSGEGFFQVTASKRHPFTVNTDNITVTAHGTVFNVQDYPTGPTACATLCSGKIDITPSGKDKSGTVSLEPGQYAGYDKHSGTLTSGRTNAEEACAWKDGDIVIRSMPIAQVFAMLERRFDIDIHMTDDRYDSAVLTAKFINDETLEQLLDAICRLVPGMTYSLEGTDVYIR